MEIENEVRDFLNEGEQIKKIFRPNRTVFLFANFGRSFSLCLFLIVANLAIIIPYLSDSSVTKYIIGITIGMVCLILIVVAIWLTKFLIIHKNTYYFLTNQRMLIRSGFKTVHYQSMKLSEITTIASGQVFADKFFGNKTGSIVLGSDNRTIFTSIKYSFRLRNVDRPYEILKKIKQFTDHKIVLEITKRNLNVCANTMNKLVIIVSKFQKTQDKQKYKLALIHFRDNVYAKLSDQEKQQLKLFAAKKLNSHAPYTAKACELLITRF